MKNIFILFFTVVGVYTFAQAPQNYYSTAEGKKESSLKTSLHDIIKGHTDKGYDGLYTIYRTSDNTSAGHVWDMYSTCTWTHGQKQCGNYSSICDCHNREHSIPQSWFSKRTPMRSDAFHVYPTDGKVNGMRSNYPFGETNAAPVGGKGLGKVGSSSFSGYSGTVFEPVDEYKGDFARTYFYFVTRYQNLIYSFSGASFGNSEYPSLSPWSINLFLKWHRQDPVSQKETDRNNAVYQHQRNRNPFIDHPELAEHIWGDKKGVAWTEGISDNPQVITPSYNSTLDLGKVPYQHSNSITVDLTAANLTGDLSLSLSGANSAYFSLSSQTISKASAEEGTKLTITCTPQALGAISATLNINGGGVSPTHIVNLKATASDSFMALAASDVTTSSFTANWTQSVNATGYLLDVYTYEGGGTTAVTLLEEGFDNGAPSGWLIEGYSDTQEAGALRMASASTSCTLTTPLIDLSETTQLTVRAKQYGSDTGATIEVEVDSEYLTTFTTNKEYQSYTVTIPETSSGSTISLKVTKGKRVYLDHVKVGTDADAEIPVSISGYPKEVGNVLQYNVDNLENKKTYYYTVKPQGNGVEVSDAIQVTTGEGQTNTEDIYEPADLVVYFSNNILYVSNLEKGSRVAIYDIIGTKLLEVEAANDQLSLPLDLKGLFILQATQGNRVIGSRKMILH